jgi:hypothetical protein
MRMHAGMRDLIKSTWTLMSSVLLCLGVTGKGLRDPRALGSKDSTARNGVGQAIKAQGSMSPNELNKHYDQERIASQQVTRSHPNQSLLKCPNHLSNSW